VRYDFIIGENYSRKDVKRKIGSIDPDDVGGNWGTGYTSHDCCYFIFANLQSAGRTGHNYGNILQDNCLYWHSKNTHKYTSNTIQRMLSGEYEIYIFTRANSSNPLFNFNGLGYVRDIGDKEEKPFHIVWGLTDDLTSLPRELQSNHRISFIEGTRKDALVTKYERNTKAREACLEYWGYSCRVCEMSFEEKYGDIGRSFIHVHHLIEIATIGEEYNIDGVNDLRPVCPNCHAMIHRRRPAYSIEEVREKYYTTSHPTTTTLL